MLPTQSRHRTAALGDAMEFDTCSHQMNQLMIKAGRIFRQLKGMPIERNITVLLNEASALLGVQPRLMDSSMMNKLPSILPRRNCQKCGGTETVSLKDLCPKCADAEGGKFRSAWLCSQCGEKVKSEKAVSQWIEEFRIDIPEWATKKSLGIQTITDDGIK